MKILVSLLVGLLLTPLILFADEADVVKVLVQRDGSRYTFEVTVAHHDEGWNHYANSWEIVAPDGKIIATRTLYHPHVDKQPFTRSLSGVVIDSAIKSVTVRAHDLVHGYGGDEKKVELLQ